MRRPRQLIPGAYWEVTVNCARKQFRLRPDEDRTQCLGYFLGKALKACPGIRLLCVSQMSNHFHLVLRDDDSELSKFMCLYLGPLAKYINGLDETTGPVFERRFAGIRAIDGSAVLDRIAYAAVNPVDAGLVERMEDWPGLIAWPGQKQDRTFALRRCHTSMQHQTDSYELTIARDLLTAQDLEWLEADIQRRLDDCAEARDGLPVLGADAVRALDPFDAPSRSKRSPMPICHASCLEGWWNYVQEWRLFVAAYRVASQRFRSGNWNVQFPDFSFRPWSSVSATWPSG